MSNRITVTDLRSLAQQHNEYMASSGSNYFFVVGGRNGYQAVDLHYYSMKGLDRCLRNVGAGTSRQCCEYLRQESNNLRGKVFTDFDGGLRGGRTVAKAVLAPHIDFIGDFHTLPSWKVDALVTWAKLTKYRKPESANGSTARYFFAHLAKIKVEG
jgi:hypothetical protein